MTDANDGSALFRAVRAEVPGSGLSVESSVRGMLSNNEDYRFNPLALPPAKTVQGRMVFIISSLDDGTSFTDALSSAFKLNSKSESRDRGSDYKLPSGSALGVQRGEIVRIRVPGASHSSPEQG